MKYGFVFSLLFFLLGCSAQPQSVQQVSMQNKQNLQEKQAPTPKEEEVQQKPAVASPKNSEQKVVVLDPGHGGPRGAGTELNGVTEASYVLDTAIRAKGLLEQKGYKVVLTRDGNFLPGEDIETKTGYGYDTYMDGPTSDEKNKLFVRRSLHYRAEVSKKYVAQYGKENVIFLSIHFDGSANKGLLLLPIETKSNRTMEFCQDLKEGLFNAVGSSFYNNSVVMSDNNPTGVQKKYYFKDASYGDGALVEMFANANSIQDSKALTEEYRQKFAVGITNGIAAFFGQ